MTAAKEPTASVLGHLMLLQSTTHVLIDETQRAEFLCVGLTRVPGVSWTSFCLDGRLIMTVPRHEETNLPCKACTANPDSSDDSQVSPVRCIADCWPKRLVFPLATAFNRYGYLVIGIDDEVEFLPYMPFVESLANTVALLFETERQAEEIEAARKNLETRVKVRTAELAEVNEKLRERDHFIRRILSTAPTLIYIFDLTLQKNVFVNDRISIVLGYTSEQIQAFGEALFPAILHPDDFSVVRDHQKRLMKASDSDVIEVEYRLRHAEGHFCAIHSWESIFARNDAGVPTRTAGIGMDVTAEREREARHTTLEQQFLAAQRMDAVGRLAGGIAHDFNNLLAVIISYADFTLDDLPPADPLRFHLKQIAEAGNRAAALTGQLLAFSRKQVLKLEIVDPNKVVATMEAMLERVIGEDIQLTVEASEHTGRVEADVGQLEQVIMNLAVNARDAMPKGGALTIKTAQVTLGESDLTDDTELEPGPYVKLSVSDTGFGMDADTKQRIFEPFFTTKPAGRGTGLGLSTVFGIVKQIDGDIIVESRPGHGTTVDIYLPVTQVADAPRVSRHTLPRDAAWRGDETVLVVEDEEAIRDLILRILRSEGYRVLQAETGGDAIALCEQYESEIHLLLSDVVMPGMDGKALADRLTQVRPALKVLFMSGYTAEVIAKRGVLDEDMCFIPKPFRPKELKAAVRQALDQI